MAQILNVSSIRRLIRTLPVAALCMALFSVAVAQGQTPTSPNLGNTGDGLGSDFGSGQNPPGPRQQPNTSAGTGSGRFGQDSDTSSGGGRFDQRDRPASSDRINRRDGAGADNNESGPRTETGEAAAGDAADKQPPSARPSRGAREGGATAGTARSVGAGSAGGGGSARATRGAGGAVTVVGETNSDYFWSNQPIEYEEIPDAGDPMTLNGPMPMSEFINALNFATNWNIFSTEAARAVQLDFWIVEQKPADALAMIAKTHDLYFEWNDDYNYLWISTVEEFRKERYAQIESHEFKVTQADVTYIESILSSLLSSQGRIITDQRTNRIYVWDTKYNLEQMIKTVQELDVPLLKETFTVMHADLADIESVITSLLTPNGSTIIDPRTNQIFVWDSPTALQYMREAVERLDVPVEARTYQIAHVLAEDVVDSLEALLSERGQIQVDPRTNVLVVRDLPPRLKLIEELINTFDRELETRTWVIRYADLDFIADQIESQIPPEMGEIIVNEEVYQITVTGLPDRLDKVDELIATWDKKRPQVMIEAFLVDLDDRVTRELNVQWSYFINNNGSPVVINSATGGFPGLNSGDVSIGQLPYAVPLYGALQLGADGGIERPILTDINGDTLVDRFRGNNLSVALNYLDQTSNTRVLAAPRVTVQDGEEAIFENAERVPFASATTTFSSGVNFGGNSTSRIEFVDVGIILRVRPRISDDGTVLLDIAAEDSSAELVEIETFAAGGSDDSADVVSRRAPQVRSRNVETQVRITSGETVVLGGLRQNRAADRVNQMPILGDLPIIGRLFEAPARDSAKTSLMIFITPTIVGDETFPESRELAAVDESIANSHRFNSKDFWERMEHKISGGAHEFAISVGQGGDLMHDGKNVSVEEMRTKIFEIAKERPKTRIVVRRHARAPEEVVSALAEAALEAGLSVDFEEESLAVVTPPTAPPPLPSAVVSLPLPGSRAEAAGELPAP